MMGAMGGSGSHPRISTSTNVSVHPIGNQVPAELLASIRNGGFDGGGSDDGGGGDGDEDEEDDDEGRALQRLRAANKVTDACGEDHGQLS